MVPENATPCAAAEICGLLVGDCFICAYPGVGYWGITSAQLKIYAVPQKKKEEESNVVHRASLTGSAVAVEPERKGATAITMLEIL